MVDERVVGWLRRRTALVDAATAGLLVLVCVLFGLLIGADAAYFTLSVLVLAPLTVRRRWPEAAALAVAAVAFAQWCAVRDTTGALPADVAVPIAVYTLAAHSRRLWSRTGLVVGLAGAVLGGWSWPQLPMSALAHVLVGGFLASTVLAAWLGGAWQRARRGEFRALAEHAALLERTRDERARLAVLSERTRIARDMHDILAHSLAVIVAQADGGRYAARAAPQSAIDALQAIGDQGRRALAETRRAIGVLREDTETEPDPAPRVGISDIHRLVEEVRGAGVPVALELELPCGLTDSGVGLVVYRIVQEGLTNVVKHAGPGARAEVSVRQERDWLRVSVGDDGPSGQPSGSPGYGLVGMRERVEAYGGELELRPRAGTAGHVLTARIPVRAGYTG
ncbi:putative two-component histidine kinase [Nocardia brasiliensis NBRC 14402]|uniref:sensor histidine kinase n=1 Tax=Nocardia brasiliensis TaxID=37326 RepID=UPI000309E130|nr:histidine kinase [Nocardia brasiliensis]ASF06615.1 two-component sensor histidine kinase [Nocardia brasiliensis]GAJ84692.1 putative two-component histidine kinase [Nocardia brasiliensis NBRC 14402]